MNPLPTNHLSTPRLVLRPVQPDDVESLCTYRTLPEVARYQSWESFGPEDAARLIDDQQDREPDVPGTWFQLAIVEKATGSMVGDCGLHCPLDEPRQMEFGITLAPSHQGRGYATETLRCLLHHAFATLGKHRVYAFTDTENHPSSALFRRLGFRQEAHRLDHRQFKGRWQSELVFALLKREWKQRAAGLARNTAEQNWLWHGRTRLQPPSAGSTAATPGCSRASPGFRVAARSPRIPVGHFAAGNGMWRLGRAGGSQEA